MPCSNSAWDVFVRLRMDWWIASFTDVSTRRVAVNKYMYLCTHVSLSVWFCVALYCSSSVYPGSGLVPRLACCLISCMKYITWFICYLHVSSDSRVRCLHLFISYYFLGLISCVCWWFVFGIDLGALDVENPSQFTVLTLGQYLIGQALAMGANSGGGWAQ